MRRVSRLPARHHRARRRCARPAVQAQVRGRSDPAYRHYDNDEGQPGQRCTDGQSDEHSARSRSRRSASLTGCRPPRVALERGWPGDPRSPGQLRERRSHTAGVRTVGAGSLPAARSSRAARAKFRRLDTRVEYEPGLAARQADRQPVVADQRLVGAIEAASKTHRAQAMSDIDGLVVLGHQELTRTGDCCEAPCPIGNRRISSRKIERLCTSSGPSASLRVRW